MKKKILFSIVSVLLVVGMTGSATAIDIEATVIEPSMVSGRIKYLMFYSPDYCYFSAILK